MIGHKMKFKLIIFYISRNTFVENVMTCTVNWELFIFYISRNTFVENIMACTVNWVMYNRDLIIGYSTALTL